MPLKKTHTHFRSVRRRRRPLAIAVCVAALLAQGCGVTEPFPGLATRPPTAGIPVRQPAVGRDAIPTTVPSLAKPKLTDARGSQIKPVEVGVASWYGRQFHGKLTASGKTFDQMEMTAAHQTLPFGSKVRVTNLANGKSVEVEINDRGPFVEDRIIDLSVAAARALDMVEVGITPVRVEVLGYESAERTSRH